MQKESLKAVVETLLLSSAEPLSFKQIKSILLTGELKAEDAEIKKAIQDLVKACEQRGVELKELASGYQYQTRESYLSWVSRLWQDKPPRYSRALLETLAIIAYRQPVTRADIESVRGVAVSSSTFRILEERGWIRVQGHKESPGRPALYGTSKAFLDYFGLSSLRELPKLPSPEEISAQHPAFHAVGREERKP